MINKKIVLLTIPTLAVLGLLVSFFSKQSEKEIKPASSVSLQKPETNGKEQEEHLEAENQVDSHAHDDQEDEEQSEVKSSDTELKVFPASFDFQKESLKLAKLKKEYPTSKKELMRSVLSKNNFSAAKAHSAAELAQRQQGALKVEALKTIFKLEKDKVQLKSDLTMILATAEDPVIVRIAKAALDSLDKGRPFFSDTTKALENLPIPD